MEPEITDVLKRIHDLERELIELKKLIDNRREASGLPLFKEIRKQSYDGIDRIEDK